MKREFRFKTDLYALLIMWEIFSIVVSIAAFQRPRQSGDLWIISSLLFVLFHGPSALGAWCLWQSKIVVDEAGLCFRGMLRTRCVAWEEIEDFGWECGQSRIWAAMVWIKDGPKKQLLRLYPGFDELRELIAERAVNAPWREWALVGARDCDEWPKTFAHRDTLNWKIGAVFLGWAALMVLQLSAGAVDKGWAYFAFLFDGFVQTWEEFGGWGHIGFAVSLLVGLLGLPVLMTTFFSLGVRSKRRFLEQSIVVTREGLEQWNGPSRRTCAWESVDRYELEQIPGMLETSLCVVWAGKQRFDWHSGIENRRLLCAIVEQRVVNAQTHKWQYRSGASNDILGGELSLWPSGVVGVGAKRYHYRTRTSRALLFLGWFILLVVFIVPFVRRTAGSSSSMDTGDVMGILLFSPVVALTLGGMRAYYASWIERDEEGLHQSSIFGRRNVRWNEIRRVQLNEYYLEICGDKTKVRVGPVADQEHLLSDIERWSGATIERSAKVKSGV